MVAAGERGYSVAVTARHWCEWHDRDSHSARHRRGASAQLRAALYVTHMPVEHNRVTRHQPCRRVLRDRHGRPRLSHVSDGVSPRARAGCQVTPRDVDPDVRQTLPPATGNDCCTKCCRNTTRAAASCVCTQHQVSRACRTRCDESAPLVYSRHWPTGRAGAATQEPAVGMLLSVFARMQQRVGPRSVRQVPVWGAQAAVTAVRFRQARVGKLPGPQRSPNFNQSATGPPHILRCR